MCGGGGGGGGGEGGREGGEDEMQVRDRIDTCQGGTNEGSEV